MLKTKKRTKQLARHDQGFTLIEVMIAVVITAVIAAAAFTMLTTTSKSVRANEQTVDMQQNARIAMEIISRDIKLAGFGSPGVPIGNCTYPIMPSDNTPGGSDTGPDSVQLLVPTTRATASGTINSWQLKDATTSAGAAEIILKDNAVTDMESAGLVDGSYVSINGAFTARVTAHDAGAHKLTVAIPAPVWFPANSQVYLLQCIRYQVVTNPATCGSNEPCLTRGVAGVLTGPSAEAPIVEGIADLQLAYGCDGCVSTINGGNPDRVIDDQNGSNSFDQGDFLSNKTPAQWDAAPLTPDKIQLVQASLVASQPKADLGIGETANATQGSAVMTVSSDHTLPADPNHRRRLLTKTLETRNVGY